MNDFDYDHFQPSRKPRNWLKIILYIFSTICVVSIAVSVCYTVFKLDGVFNDLHNTQIAFQNVLTSSTISINQLQPDLLDTINSVRKTSIDLDDLIQKASKYIS